MVSSWVESKIHATTAELIFGVKFYRVNDSCCNSRVYIWDVVKNKGLEPQQYS